ncbi:hypothetical protein O9929_06580 [Vibrio lentus]|nr:hypothetical protein [Vibrio lentus]
MVKCLNHQQLLEGAIIMCSVSWLLEDNGYQSSLIVMNKDTALAMPPKQISS